MRNRYTFSVCIVLGLSFLGAFFLPTLAWGQDGETSGFTRSEIEDILETPTPQISLPGLSFRDPTVREYDDGRVVFSSPFLSDYLKAIYRYAVGTVSIIATVALIAAGMLWATSAGNQDRVARSKKMIVQSIIGLLLAVGSYSILALINPELIRLRDLNIEFVQPQDIPEAFDKPLGTLGVLADLDPNANLDDIFKSFGNCIGVDYRMLKAKALIESGLKPNSFAYINERGGLTQERTEKVSPYVGLFAVDYRQCANLVRNGSAGFSIDPSWAANCPPLEVNGQKVSYGPNNLPSSFFNPWLNTAAATTLFELNKKALVGRHPSCANVSAPLFAMLMYVAHNSGSGTYDGFNKGGKNTKWPDMSEHGVFDIKSEAAICNSNPIAGRDALADAIYQHWVKRTEGKTPNKNGPDTRRKAHLAVYNAVAKSSAANIKWNDPSANGDFACPFDNMSTSFKTNSPTPPPSSGARVTPDIVSCGGSQGQPGRKVLVVGDSLSNASYAHGGILKRICDFDVTKKTKSGEVTQTMVEWVEDIARTPAGLGQYDDIIILGGTNDVTNGNSATAIQNNLTAMYRAAKTDGVRVIAITIPPYRKWPRWSETKQIQLEALNAWIRNKGDGLIDVVVDMYPIFEHPQGSMYMNEAYTNDGLHPNAKSGSYNLLAAEIARQAYQ